MKLKRIKLALFGMWVAILGAGCEKSEPVRSAPAVTSTPAAPAAAAGETVARVHWLGKKRLATEATGTNFMGIWNLPTSVKLLAQTLDKLSVAPWRPATGDSAVKNTAAGNTNIAATLTNAAAAKFRPLLDDMVSEESFLEVRQLTNQTGEVVFAIRLSEERSRLWETNLASVFESLTTLRPVPATGDRPGWSLKQPRWPQLVELTRAGEWTVVGAAAQQNSLLGETLARIQRDHAPVAAPGSNIWFEADVDLARAAKALVLDWKIPAEWPRVSLTLSSKGENVLTRGTLNFAQPLPFELEAWNIPTNLIHEPLAGFTAMRGVSSWLSGLRIWNDLQLGPPPKQLFLWSLDGVPMETYFAAAMPDTAKTFDQLTARLLGEGNAWLATTKMGKFQSSNGVTAWTTTPFATPQMQVFTNDTCSYLMGGFIQLAESPDPLAAELYNAVTNLPNLVYYDWEYTAARTEKWIYLSQWLRLVLQKPQLPLTAGLTWLKEAGPRLGNCATRITRTGPRQLELARSSSCGFTGVELHLLVDWLESPDFPHGLYSLTAPLETLDDPTAPVPADPPGGLK